MKTSALKFIQRGLFLALGLCLVWTVYIVTSFHVTSLTRVIHSLGRSGPPQTHMVRTQTVTASREADPMSGLEQSTQRTVTLQDLLTTALWGDQAGERDRADARKTVLKVSAQNGQNLGRSRRHSHSSVHDAGPQSLSSSALKIVSKLGFLRSDDHLAQNESFFIPRKTVVNNFTTQWLIQASCPSKGPDLLVVIPSVQSHHKRRRAIRETWGSLAYGGDWPGVPEVRNASVKVLFFLGVSRSYNHQHVHSEALAFRDVVVGDFVDSYQNLSLKMALVLQWVDVHCAGAQHVLKVDEDTFVNIPLLLNVLRLVSASHSRFVLGHKKVGARPKVSRWGRWKTSKEAYPLHHWPKYLYGHSYVISGDAISNLRHASRHLPLISNEDAYLTGVLAKSAGLLRVGCVRFAMQRAVYPRCHLVSNLDVSQTGFTVQGLYDLWGKVNTGKCSDSQ